MLTPDSIFSFNELKGMASDFANFSYEHLSHLSVGRIGEYWTKLWLTLAGLETYYNDVDDRGIDFVVRLDDSKHIDVQVKTIRAGTGYVFVSKHTWGNTLRANLYLALVILRNNQSPSLYLIPSTAWLAPNELLRDREYRKELGQTSKPEWGVNVSQRNMPLLEAYSVEHFIQSMKGS
ncbi:DUF4365 domain-containing protein [Hymenobacter gummosus]|uniref:DUF4365 domain-containing protein n=1 Tax=Hymenobacter gummosus TaxID=1776032 RepID=A0A3S0K4I8_9BACT|nr:DUF4365 domain-containing protein [Hymenobacter gummosus]RTQ48913.1 DUF4365 domain-containing protein [Hymenobacter gummosus]